MFFGTCFTGSSSFFLGKSTYYSDILHDVSVTIPKCYKDVYINSFFPRTARLLNLLPIESFPLTYDHRGFKSRIYRRVLNVGFFKQISCMHGVNPN